MIFDVVEAHCLGAGREVRSVSAELVNLSEVYKCSDAGCEQGFYLLLRDAWTPGVFTGKEEGSGPVGVWDWTLEGCVDGGVLLLPGEKGIDEMSKKDVDVMKKDIDAMLKNEIDVTLGKRESSGS